MSKKLFTYLMLPLLLLFCNSSQNSVAGSKQKSPDVQSGTLEKMIVASGSVAMDVLAALPLTRVTSEPNAIEST